MLSVIRPPTAAISKSRLGIRGRYNLWYWPETSLCFRPVINREICTPALSRPSELVRDRQRGEELAAVARGAQRGRELVGDMPGKDDGAVGLIGKQAAFLDHRNRRPRHALADLERARDLADVVDDGLVEAEIVDQGRGARGRAD